MTPRQLLEEAMADLRVAPADRELVARLVADHLVLVARAAAGENVDTELAISNASLANTKANFSMSAMNVAWHTVVKIAAVLLK